MITRRIILSAMVFLTAGMAQAQSVKLTAAQITELLNGNTAIGEWGSGSL